MVAVVVSAAAPARASLTSSESEQVRRAVATATDLPRVRALVARPDLTSEEAAAALASPMAASPVDGAHVAFLDELVFGDVSEPARAVLAPAALRAVLARADALIAQHPLDLERSRGALDELAAAYAFVERLAAFHGASLPDSARAECARALADHLAHQRAVLGPQSRADVHVRQARAQAAIALLDLMPDAPTRRIDAADALGLTGARRDLLVQRGVLALDGGGADEHPVAALRALLERLPALRDGVEAVVAGSGAPIAARDGAVITVPDDPGSAGPALLWGRGVKAPVADAWTTSAARALAFVAVARAAALHDGLRADIERDGGVPAVAGPAAMLVLDAPLALDATVTRAQARREVAARLADAVAALAAFALPAPGGPAVPVGPAGAVGSSTNSLGGVALDPTGAASAFVLDGRSWSFEHDPAGAVIGLRRGKPVPPAPGLGAMRPP